MYKGQCDYMARDTILSRIPVGIHLRCVYNANFVYKASMPRDSPTNVQTHAHFERSY